MNKNTLIGTLLLIALFMGMTYWNGKTASEQEKIRREKVAAQQAFNEEQQRKEADARNLAESLTSEQRDSLALVSAFNDSLKTATKFGPLAAATVGEERIVTIENSLLSIDINTHGGMIERVALKPYQNQYDSTNLVLFNAENNSMELIFEGRGNYRDDISTKELFFEAVNETPTGVTMRLKSIDGGVLDLVYALSEDSYLVDFSVKSENIKNIVHDTRFNLKWDQKLLRTELGRDFEERYSSLFYRFDGESPDDDELESSTKNGKRAVSGPLTWFNFKNQFFSSILVSRNIFTDGELRSSIINEDDRQGKTYLKDYTADLYFDLEQDENLCFFFGPNNYSLLNDLSEEAAAKVGLGDVDIELEQTIYLGWPIVRWVNRFIVLPVFHWLDSYGLNYGLIILLLTLLIKGITFPFTRKSMLAGAKMRIANQMPEVKKINEKYPNQEDAMQKQQELMALYGKMGVNQMGGCVPMLFQWPVLIALFYFFPTSIELRGQSFLWAHDLSTYDAIISWSTYIPIVDWIFHQHISLFCVLMTITNIFYTWLMQKQNPAQQSMPGMQAMMYLMPLMFLAILNNYSAGLSYYYFLSTLIGIIQTYAIRASLNEKKILEQLTYNLHNPKKKSENSGCAGWAARLQEVKKQQEADMKKQQKARMRKM